MKLSDLNLSTTTKPKTRNPITHRRLTLLKSITKQIQSIDNSIEGNSSLVDVDTGRRINNWYWLDESGNYFLTINYGRVLEVMGKLSGSGFTKVALISEPYKER